MKKSTVVFWVLAALIVGSIVGGIVVSVVFMFGLKNASDQPSAEQDPVSLVSATFCASDEQLVPTNDQLETTASMIKHRLESEDVRVSSVIINDETKRISADFYWNDSEEKVALATFIDEISKPQNLTFVLVEEAESDSQDAVSYEANGTYSYYVVRETILDGSVIESASALYNLGNHAVALDFNEEGTSIFSKATEEHCGEMIGVMLDDVLYSVATVEIPITDGNAMISSGDFDAESVSVFADKINCGPLPFELECAELTTKK